MGSPRRGVKLRNNGILSAYDLAQADESRIRQKYSVVMQRTVQELNGKSCISIDDLPEKKQLLVSRSFRERVTSYDHIRSLLAGYISRACEKLRLQGSVTKSISVFIRTSPFSEGASYSNSMTIRLNQYTADTATLIKAGSYALEKIFKDGYDYQKAGIMLFDIAPDHRQQLCLFQAEKYDNNAPPYVRLVVPPKIHKQMGQRGLNKWHTQQNAKKQY